MKNFWESVEQEVKFKGMTNKELASKAGFNASNISKGKKDGSFPAVDTAYRIAKVLNVTVEYLLTGSDPKIIPEQLQDFDIHKIHMYAPTIDALDALPANTRNPIMSMIQEVKIHSIQSPELPSNPEPQNQP